MKQVFASMIASGIILVSAAAQAFPDLIRHGYTNCTACHISPSGAGVLNPYGRSLSKEILSTRSYEKEELPLHGLIDTKKVEEWLAIGGDFRAVQVHQENEMVKRGSFIKMQAGVEVALFQPQWALVSFIGEWVNKDEWQPYSSRYYGYYTPIEGLYFKAGRFLPNFGIQLPDHIFSTRGPLLMGYGMERDTAEISWLGEEWNFSGSYYKSPQKISTNNQTGFVGQILKAFGDDKKAGVQYLSEKDDLQERKIMGALAQLSWSKKFVTLLELDQQLTTPVTGLEKKGVYALHRTSYEFYRGVNFVILNDYLQTDIDKGATKDYKYGPGIQWFPRPHWDLQAFWTRQQSGTLKEGDYAWLVLHYYL